MVREHGGTAILIAGVAALLALNMVETGWGATLPWKRGDWSPPSRRERLVLMAVTFLVLAAVVAGAVMVAPVLGTSRTVSAFMVVILVAISATKTSWWSLISLALVAVMIYWFLTDPGMLTAQLVALTVILLLFGGVASLLPFLFMARRPMYWLVSLPLWLVAFVPALIKDHQLKTSTEGLYWILYHAGMPSGTAVHPPLAESTSLFWDSTWDIVRYAPPSYSPAFYTLLVSFMVIGVTTLWSRYFCRLSLVVWPLVGWAAGIAAGVILTVTTGNQALNGLCLAVGVITGTSLAMWQSGFWRELLVFRPQVNPETIDAQRLDR